jgi:hypothetical protein
MLTNRFTQPIAGLVAVIAIWTCAEGPTEPGFDSAVDSIALSHGTLTLAIADSTRVWIEARNASGQLLATPNVEWSSSAPATATVIDGLIRGVASGTVKVVVRSQAVADTIDVTVLPPITAMALTTVDTIRDLNAEVQVRASSMSGSTARQGTYAFVIRDATVASFAQSDAAGRVDVQGRKSGETYLVATERSGAQDSVLVVVRPKIARVRLAPNASNDLIAGFLGRFVKPVIAAWDQRGTSVPPAGVVLVVSDTSIARADTGGTLLMKQIGSTTVEAIAPSGARARRELQVNAQPKITGVLITNGRQLDVTPVGTRQIARGGAQVEALEQPITVSVQDSALASAWIDPSAGLVVQGQAVGNTSLVLSSKNVLPDTLLIVVSETKPRFWVPTFSTNIGVGASREAMVRLETPDGLWRELPEDVTVTVTSLDESVVRVGAGGPATLPFGKLVDSYVGVTLHGIAPGTATVRLSAPGFPTSDTTFTVTSATKLNVIPDGVTTMGARQSTSPPALRGGKPWRILGGLGGSDVLVTFQHSHPSVAQTPSDVTVTSGHHYLEFNVTALTSGTDTIVASAPGFLPDTTILVVTTPKLIVPDTVNGSVPIIGTDIAVGDSLGNSFGPLADVRLGLTTDTPALLSSLTASLPAGWYFGGNLHGFISDTGTASVTATDSAGIVPTRTFVFRSHQNRNMKFVYQDLNDFTVVGQNQKLTEPVYLQGFHANAVLAMSTSSTAILTNGDLTSISASEPTVEIRDVVAGEAKGAATLTVSAKGYETRTSVPVQVGTPRFVFVRTPESVTVGELDSVRIALADPRGRVRRTTKAVSLRLEAVGGGLQPVDLTVAADGFQTPSIPVVFTRAGILQVIARDIGTGAVTYDADTASINVLGPATVGLRFPAPALTIGLGQRLDINLMRVGVPAVDPLTATVASRTGRVTHAESVGFAAGAKYATLQVVGKSLGGDTLSAIAPGLAGDTMRIVTTNGYAQLLGTPSSYRQSQSYTVTLATTDSTGVQRAVDVETEFAIAVSGSLAVTDKDGVPITTIRIAAGESQSTPFNLKAGQAGPATLLISRLDYLPVRRQVTVSP